MREVYLLACGIVLGIMVRDYMESLERRIAYRAADQAAENLDMRSRWKRDTPAADPIEPTAAPDA